MASKSVITQHPKREKRLDKYSLPQGFEQTFAKDLKRDQFFFFHMSGKRWRADEVTHGVLTVIRGCDSSGKYVTRCVLPDKILITYA